MKNINEIFQFLEVKFSIYLNRQVFIIQILGMAMFTMQLALEKCRNKLQIY